MKFASVFAIATAAVACLVISISAMPVQDEPPFCRHLDCPAFNTLNHTNDYDVRQYEASQWARTVIETDNYTNAADIGFHRLFNYISGQNVDHKKIPMTAPVSIKVSPGAGPYCNSSFVVSFMVPFANQPNPPKPTSSDIYIESEPRHIAYVASFPGFAQESDFIEHAGELAQALMSDGISFNTSAFYTAGYDSPYQLFNRHNEVWFYPNGAQ